MKEKKKKGPAQLYLEKIEKLEKQISRKKDKAALYRSKAGSTTQSMNTTGASGGGNRDKLGGWMDAAMDLEEEIKADERMLKDRVDEVYALLDQIKNDDIYKVLEMHYLQYMPFDQIAPKIPCSYRNTLYLHGRALQVFGKLLEEHQRENDRIRCAQDILKEMSIGKIELNVHAADLRAIDRAARYET